MNDPDAPSSADDAVGPVVEAFLDRFRRGERPSLSDLVARHPEMADELREIIPALVELEQIGGSTGSFSGSTGGRLRPGRREPSGEPGRLQDPSPDRRRGHGGGLRGRARARSRAGWRSR